MGETSHSGSSTASKVTYRCSGCGKFCNARTLVRETSLCLSCNDVWQKQCGSVSSLPASVPPLDWEMPDAGDKRLLACPPPTNAEGLDREPLQAGTSTVCSSENSSFATYHASSQTYDATTASGGFEMKA
ncbi:hypothetical protein KEM55_007421, partial [Ascosphaera atra]